MSCSSTDSGASPPPLEDERELVKPVSELLKRAKPGHPTRRESNPIIIAAYRYGDPYHKRRVKVPAHITWREFLGLLYSRLEVEGNCDIGIYDENGIEIVSVDDLVPNDVLVVRERRKASVTDYSQFGYHPQRSHGKRADDRGQGSALQRSEEVPTLQQTSSYTVGMAPRRPHDALGGDPSGPIRLQEQLLPPVGTPLLTHFIRANSFGYYFLAEVDSVRVGGGAGGGGKTKRAHCVVKVPPCDKSADSAQIFEMEATLLRKVSGHRSVIASPTVQILNFASEFLQLFFSHLPEYKQPPLAELFFSGTCSEAYIYPLYGVTMATKIKSGLSPEKTVRYAYQLADTMLFLQQRGVIHQTLLPENIQVMSNDRVMVCNFETAVQTDPATCTLLISRSLVAPSNRMGLAPEILNAFNRGNVETIDFSTQYPWSFGALSVVMATGQHPLRNYPSRYITEGRVKYRSHNYQALPDSSKYPSLFCRLVKRSLSCDPLRRPSLFQITSIMKKDSRTLTMMSSLNRKSNAVPSQGARSSHPRESAHDHREHREHREHGDHGDLERSGDSGTTDVYTLSRHKPHSATAARAASFSHSAHPTSPDHDHTSPSKRTKTDIQPLPFLDEYQHFQTHSRSHDPQQRSHDSHVSSYEPQRSRESYSRSHDPHDSPNAAHRLRPQPHPEQRQQTRQFTQSYEGGRSPARSAALGTGQPNRGGRESWSDVGRMSPRDSPHIPRPPSRTDLGATNPRPSVSDSTFSQQRRVSLGGFSDDFAPPGRHFTTGPSGGRGVEEVTQSQSSVRYLEVQKALHEQRMSRKRSSATSESDGNGTLTLDTEYQQLLPEDSPDELQTTQTAGTETERGGTHNRQQQERSPRSSFQSHTPPYMQVATARGDQAISNRSDHQEGPPRSSSAQDLRFGLRHAQQKVRSYEAMRRPLRKPSEDDFRRTLSQQPAVEYDGGSLDSSPASRRCHSDSETRVGRPRERAVSQGGSLHSSPIPAMQPYSNPLRFSPLTIPSWNSFTRSSVQNASMSTSTPPHTADPLTGSRNVVPSDGGLQMEYREGGFHQSRGDAESPRGREGAEPMQISPNNTQLAFEISDQFSDISTSAQVGAASVNQTSNVSHQQQFVQSPAVQMTPSALVEANSGVGQTVQHWDQQQLVGAGEASLQAGELQMDYEAHHRGSGSGSQHVSLPFQSSNQQTNAYASAGAVQGHSNQLQHFTLGSRPSLPPSAQRLESQGISIHHRSSDSREDASAELSGGNQLWTGDSREQQTAQPTENESETPQPALPMNPAVTTVYSGPHIMSPIAEASQEYSTQQTTTHTYSATQTQHTQFTQSMHSLSPLPEQTREQQPRRSSSPFQHHALGEAVTTPLSPGVVSDTTNVSITSQVARVVDRSQTPQLEPPSTSSDTSHSLTRSSEVDSSITNAQADAYVPPQRNEGGDLRSLGQQNRTSAVQGNAAVAQYPSQSLPHAIVDVSDRSSQITPTVEVSSIDFAAIHSQSRLEFPEQEDSILSPRGDPQAPFTSSGTFQSSGTYQSTISEGSRERHGQRGSTPRSTISAPVGYSSQQSRHHRRVRRSSSPGSGTPSALSDSVAVQFQAARRTPIPSRQQERSHPHDQTASLSQRSQGRGRHRGNTGGSSGSGTGSHTAHRISQDLEMMTRAIEGMDSGQQQLEGSLERDRRASLIREELLQASSSHSPSPSRSLSVGSHGTRPTGSVSRGVANRYHASMDTRQQFRPITPAIATNSRRSSSVEPSSNHRISHRNTGRSYTASVTPDLNQARGSTDDARNYNFHHIPNLQNSLVGLSQIAPNEDSPDPIRHATLELGTPNLAQSGTPSTQIDPDILSPVQFPSAVVPEEDRVVSQRESIVPPPQAGMDSYDYLPPYSPPRPVEEPANQALQRNTVQAGQQQVYPDPPPSYEEIFGQQSQGRQRQRQRRPSRQPRSRPEEDAARVESQSQAERSSHRSGGSRTSGHRRLSSLTSLFKRNRRHSHDAHTSHSLHHSSRTPSHEQQNQASSTSPAPDNQDSLTQSGTVENRRQADGPAPSTLQRTASWVASYSQTPRPITAYQQLERGLREGRGGEDISSSVSAAGITSHPSTDSQVSRSLSDTAAMGVRVNTSSSHSQPTHIRHHTQPPGAGLPSYRHPPPFLRTPQGTSAHSPTLTNCPTMPYSRPLVHSRGSSLNFSQPNIPTLLPSQSEPNGADTSNSAHQDPVFRRVLAHHPRTRPASTHMMSSELGRIGSSMSSILPIHDFSVQQNVITSAIERLRSDERSLEASVSGVSSNGPEDQQQRSQETREHLPPRRPYPSQQHDRLENGEGRNLGANGNANNDNRSPTSPNEPSPNATPSPVFRRRSQDQSQERELNVANSLQPKTLTSENGASQNGNGITARAGSGSRRNSGERGSCSQRSTPRSRAASRRLAQQLSSSDEDTAVASSSSSSRGKSHHHRRRQGSGNSHSSSQQGSQSQNSPFASPLESRTPVFFPSFQSQTVQTLPDDGIFSAISNDLTAQSVTLQEFVKSHVSHVTSHPASQNQQAIVMSQGSCNTSQPIPPSVQDASHDSRTPPADMSHDHTITSPNGLHDEVALSPDMSHDRPTPTVTESHDQGEESHDDGVHELSELLSNSAGELDSATPATSASHSVTDSHTLSLHVSKPCGHVCVAEQLEVCCECMQTRSTLDDITGLLQSCEICESRRLSGQECCCVANKLNNACPIHGSRGQSSFMSPLDPAHTHPNRKHIKNCIVM